MSEAERIAEIRARVDAATPGEWTVTKPEGYCDAPSCICARGNEFEGTDICKGCADWKWSEGAWINAILTINCGEYDGMNEEDAEFIAHARQDIPWLIEQVERLERENAVLRAQEQNEPLTLRGYDVEHLELVAELMERYQITPDDLKKCVSNFARALKMTVEVIEKHKSHVLQGIIAAHDPEYAQGKGEPNV